MANDFNHLHQLSAKKSQKMQIYFYTPPPPPPKKKKKIQYQEFKS